MRTIKRIAPEKSFFVHHDSLRCMLGSASDDNVVVTAGVWVCKRFGMDTCISYQLEIDSLNIPNRIASCDEACLSLLIRRSAVPVTP